MKSQASQIPNKMYSQLLHSKNQAFLTTRLDEDIQNVFFKCRKWQLEETLDPINCPYHYYCNSHYSGDYPSWVDNLVMFFIAASFLSTAITMVVMVVGVTGRREGAWLSKFNRLRRYFLPSGPVFLPIMIFVMAKGYRINTVFPLTHSGPAILQLIRISALSFDTESVSDFKYVFLEVSTISGVLQAALQLDSIILPYYTGLDALLSSKLSGECLSCVCRQQVLIVGGMLVYRGWSVTTALVVGTLIFRIFSRLTTEGKKRTTMMKICMESLSWILMIVESVYLLIISPPERTWIRAVSFSGVLVLICFQILRRLIISVFAAYNGNQENKERQ